MALSIRKLVSCVSTFALLGVVFVAIPGNACRADASVPVEPVWLAALLDRPGVPNYTEPGFLLMSGLIKLRDLPDNYWNADTLFLLTRTHEQARQRARIAEEEDWGGDVHVFEDQREIDRALGTGRQDYGLVSIWWD